MFELFPTVQKQKKWDDIFPEFATFRTSNLLNQSRSYLIKEVDDVIELSINAIGFTKDEIDIEVKNEHLTIKSNKEVLLEGVAHGEIIGTANLQAVKKIKQKD